MLTSTPRRRTIKKKWSNLSRNLLKTFTNQPINDDDHNTSFNITERISNIAFICAGNESIVSTKKSNIDDDAVNNNCFNIDHQELNQKLSDEKQNKKLQRDRRHSILMTKCKKSIKTGRSLREQARAKSKRQRDDIYNTCRPNLNKKTLSNGDESDYCNNLDINNQQLIDDNFPLSTKCDRTIFENLLQTKQCEMPYNNETPILPSSKKLRCSSSIDCLPTNDNSSKTIYPNTSGNRKIPYLRYSSKSFSRQTLGVTTIYNDNNNVDSCIDRPRIRLIDLCSWQQLDRSIQSIVVFVLFCIVVNIYQIIIIRN